MDTCRMLFAKRMKKSVKFGLGKRSNILLPRIGGSHHVPSLSILLTERQGTAMYYSWRPFRPLDFVLCALRALRPCDPRVSDWIVCKPLDSVLAVG